MSAPSFTRWVRSRGRRFRTATDCGITIKALGDGSALLQSIKPGTWVLAEGPSGALTARRRTRPSVLLIAGGVGITPMRALFESLPMSGGRLTLLYAHRHPGMSCSAPNWKTLPDSAGHTSSG